MAKYLTKVPGYIGEKYIDADVRNPAVVELPVSDDPALQPSTAFEPLDAEALSVLEKLAKDKGLKKKYALPNAIEPAKAVVVDDAPSSSDSQSRKFKRASDKDAI